MRVTIEVPDADRVVFEQLLAERGYTWMEESTLSNSLEVPEWQKAITLERRANAKPEDYKPWNEVKKKWGL